MAVCVISQNGERLMPTIRYGKVRHMLHDGRAVIVKHNPFTIQLTYESECETQPIEYCEDSGHLHIGISIKSEKREFVAEQRDLLNDEKEKHDDCRKLRKTRRNHLRYRKKRFSNRIASKKDGWLAPSIRNKVDQHNRLLDMHIAVMPITSITIEGGQFDTAVLQAMQSGKPIPQGTGYQQGERYGVATLREAVFQRDNYTCRFCGRSSFVDKAILHVHHMLYWQGRHGNKLSELATCCEKCHTPANHQNGGKLWGQAVTLPRLEGAAFMNIAKQSVFNHAKDMCPNSEVHLTYGAATKLARGELGLEKSHIEDAYAMGSFHPQMRAEKQYFQKKRRNNRILQKFYDAQFIDLRTGKKVKANALSCGRTNRNHKKDGENLRKYRGQKVSSGHSNIRKQRYSIQAGDTVLYQNKKYIAGGCQHYGQYVTLHGIKKAPSTNSVTVIKHSNAWVPVTQ